MSIKILVLKSGEDVIADVKEMVSEENVIGYFMTAPCIVKMRNLNNITDAEKDPKKPLNKSEFAVSMFPWQPLATETTIPVPTDWVVTMVTPSQKIIDMYTTDVLENVKEDDQTNNSDESDNLDNSD